MAAYCLVMASVTCGLTTEDRDQLRNATLVSNIALRLPFCYHFHREVKVLSAVGLCSI